MQRATSVVEPGMAEASAATTIYAYDGHNVYSSGGACLRHARPHRSVGCLRKMWVTGRLYTHDVHLVYSSGCARATTSAMQKSHSRRRTTHEQHDTFGTGKFDVLTRTP